MLDTGYKNNAKKPVLNALQDSFNPVIGLYTKPSVCPTSLNYRFESLWAPYPHHIRPLRRSCPTPVKDYEW